MNINIGPTCILHIILVVQSFNMTRTLCTVVHSLNIEFFSYKYINIYLNTISQKNIEFELFLQNEEGYKDDIL